jgi:hypothetical protein
LKEAAARKLKARMHAEDQRLAAERAASEAFREAQVTDFLILIRQNSLMLLLLGKAAN